MDCGAGSCGDGGVSRRANAGRGWAVFVRWDAAPTRAERLCVERAQTTRRIADATRFATEEAAKEAGAALCDGTAGIASWEVRPF
jgi:hypothetical protein